MYIQFFQFGVIVIELTLKNMFEAKLEINEATSSTEIVSSASGRTKIV